MKTTVNQLWIVARDEDWALFHARESQSPARFAFLEDAANCVRQDGLCSKGYKVFPVTLTIDVGEPVEGWDK